MLKYEFTLNGLNCAGCAATIENELSRVEGITGVTLDFIDKELVFYVKDRQNPEDMISFVSKLIRKIEPDVEVKLSGTKKKDVRFRTGLLEELKSCETISLLTGLVAVVIALLVTDNTLRLVLLLTGYLLIGWPVIRGAARRLFSRYLFNEHLLMSIATIGALFIGEYLEAIAVMLFYQIGKTLENKMIDYSQHSITELLAIAPDYANLEMGNQVVKTEPQNVKAGDIIIIKPGERVPLDCTAAEGASEIDNSLVTGESLPQAVEKGTKVLSGAVNLHSMFKAKVDNDFQHSTISRIVEIIKTAKAKKTRTERFITRFASIYTPIIIGMAFIIALFPPLLVEGATFETWFYRALIFLVISCPCALVISVPLSFFSGLAVLIKKGVLIKGATYIESLAAVKSVILDKTGTLTTGKMNVSAILPAEGIDAKTLMKYAYFAECHSNHPLAVAVNLEYHQMLNTHQEIELPGIKKVEEVPGKGLIVSTSEGVITIGSLSLLSERGIRYEYDNGNKYAVVGVALDDRFLGVIEFSDTIRDKIGSMISALKRKKIYVMMLTGDNEEAASSMAKETGINEYYAALKPEDKLDIVNKYRRSGFSTAKEKIVFVGDGINDAPAMSAADIGIAMGGIGAAVSIEAADIVLQTDEIDTLPQILDISRYTLNTAKQNIVFALSVKFIFLALGAMGLVTIWGAVFADVGVTLIAVLNSLRLLKYRKRS